MNLLDRLTTHREQVLLFSVQLAVPFANNLAEQDIRGVKIRQKISGSLRTMTGAQAFCRLRSYLATARNSGTAPWTSYANSTKVILDPEPAPG